MPPRKKTATKARTPAKSASTRASKKVSSVKKASSKAKNEKSTTKASKAVALPSKVIAQKQTQSQIYNEIAELTQLSKVDVKSVFSAVRNLIERHVKPKGSGKIAFRDIGIQVRRVDKKATKARMGRNPFTGEEIEIPAKPARKSVKVSALKALKAIIEG